MNTTTPQEQIDTRAIEIAVQAKSQVDTLARDIHRIEGTVETMRQENVTQHREARTATDVLRAISRPPSRRPRNRTAKAAGGSTLASTGSSGRS